jgi:hypothetical protein
VFDDNGFDPDDPMNGSDWAERLAEPSDEEMPADVRKQLSAVEKTRTEQGNELSDVEFAVRERFGVVDWAALFSTDFSKVDWLPGKFMEKGQQVTLVGDGKAGKSLLALEWAWSCVAGRAFLGDDRHAPLTVLYVDKENSPRDLYTRLVAIGATPKDLERLHYAQFPKFSGTLDGETSKASIEFMKLVEHYEADIVVIDTVSRFIGGKENDSDTWLSLYRNIHERMKAKDVACLRLDHFGKDDTKGSRGSSAKSQDVDHVWELGVNKATPLIEAGVETVTTSLKLHRTHTRTGLGRGTFPLTRVGKKAVDGGWIAGETYHEVADAVAQQQREQEENAAVIQLTAAILAAGFTGPVTQRAVKAFMKDKEIRGLRASEMTKVNEQLAFELRRAAE